MHPLFQFTDRLVKLIPEFLDEACRPLFAPNIDIAEDKDAYTVWAELPGFSRKDVEVTYREGMLTLKGEKKVERKAEAEGDVRWHSCQREIGAFEQHVRVGGPVDESKIEATMKDGVLQVRLPKSPETRGKTIDVKGE